MKTLLIAMLLTYGGQLRIIDGDTFRWEGETVRIANIDAPEMKGGCTAEIILARKATERLRELMAAKDFQLEKLARKDRYGRTLAIVKQGDTDIGMVLVEEGLARPWRGRREPWC